LPAFDVGDTIVVTGFDVNNIEGADGFEVMLTRQNKFFGEKQAEIRTRCHRIGIGLSLSPLYHTRSCKLFQPEELKPSSSTVFFRIHTENAV
jgi:hypothetical protein